MSAEKQLNELLKVEVFSKCYESLLETFRNMSIIGGDVYTIDDYVAVMKEAKTLIKMVCNSTTPEIAINQAIAKISSNYFKSNGDYSMHPDETKKFHLNTNIGAIISMTCIVGIYDSGLSDNPHIMDSLSYLRALIERCSLPYEFRADKMWKLVAERVKPINSPNQADLVEKIKRLEEQVQDTEMHTVSQRIQIEFLDKLFKRYGIASGTSNKQKAELMEMITPWTWKGIEGVYTEMPCNPIPKRYKEMVDNLNAKLKSMNIDVELSVKE